MRGDLDLLRHDFKGELLGGGVGPLPDVEFDAAGDLVGVRDLEPLDEAVGVGGGHDRAEKEGLLLAGEQVRVDERGDLLSARKGGDHDLLLEDLLVHLSVDARDARLSDNFVEHSQRLV